MQVVGAEAGRVVAAVQDMQRACQVKAKKQRGQEPVDRVAAVGDGDPSVAPAVAAALPLPAAGQRVDPPPLEQAPTERQIVRVRRLTWLRLLSPLNLVVFAADMPLHPVHLRRLTMTAVAAARHDGLPALDQPFTETLVETLDEDTLISLLLARFRSFAACGYAAADALLLAVDHPNATLPLAAEPPNRRGSPSRRLSA